MSPDAAEVASANADHRFADDRIVDASPAIDRTADSPTGTNPHSSSRRPDWLPGRAASRDVSQRNGRQTGRRADVDNSATRPATGPAHPPRSSTSRFWDQWDRGDPMLSAADLDERRGDEL